MPVALVLDFDGGTAAQYEAVVEELDLGGRAPSGCSWHGAGPTATGWRVIDVWEEPSAFRDFSQSRVAPAGARHGLAEPRVEMVEVAQVRLGGEPGEAEAFLQIVRLDGLDGDAFRAMDGAILPDGAAPPHCIYHVNGPSAAGWVVIDTWSSRAERDAFIAGRVVPAMEAAGVAGPPVIEDLDLHTVMRGAPVHA